jgi:hypothetical protein
MPCNKISYCLCVGLLTGLDLGAVFELFCGLPNARVNIPAAPGEKVCRITVVKNLKVDPDYLRKATYLTPPNFFQFLNALVTGIPFLISIDRHFVIITVARTASKKNKATESSHKRIRLDLSREPLLDRSIAHEWQLTESTVILCATIFAKLDDLVLTTCIIHIYLFLIFVLYVAFRLYGRLHYEAAIKIQRRKCSVCPFCD